MGTVETPSKAPSGGSSPMPESDNMVQGFEQEKKELEDGLGSLINGEGSCGVPEDEDGFSSLGNQGLGDGGVVEVVKSSVLETKVSEVLRENDCQVLVDSEMNGASSLFKMQESGISTVFSSDDGEKLDCAKTSESESRIAEVAVLSVCGLVGVGAEDRRDGVKCEEEEKDERDGEKLDCDKISESESRISEAAVLSVDGSVGVGVEDGRDGVKSEEEEKDEDCGANVETIEIPIEEASEYMDVKEEELSDEGYGFAVGDFVWGKIKSRSWWPGRVYDPADASDRALKMKQKKRLLVAYFGDGTFAWCHPSELNPFVEHFDDMVKLSSSIAFVNAVQEAVNEVGRLLFLKMSLPFVAEKTWSESTLLLAKNSGIKEGVLVPENDIERLLDVPLEPAELLSRVKQIAEIVDIASILELEILKAQLSAFYLSKGGYKLPDNVDPQPVSGFEDSLMDGTVEALVQGPFEEEFSTLLANGSNLRRKQKSIAEIMGEDIDDHIENEEGDASDQMVDAIGSGSRKKRKKVQKKNELLLDTDRNVSSTENDGIGEEESIIIGTLMQSKKKKEGFGNEIISSESKKETDEGETEEPNKKGSLSRERKKSKYLSPPFTTCNGEAFQENFSKEVTIEWELSNISNYQTQEDENNAIDPKKIQAPVGEVLCQVHYAAISPLIRREGTPHDQFVDFISVFRSSLYRQGSLHKVYKKQQPGRKRKKAESEHGKLRKDQSQSDHIPPDQDFQPTKRRRETAPGMPKARRACETNTDMKGSDENDPGAVLFVSFWPGSSLPSKSDLIRVYSEIGALNEAETAMFRTNYTARVSFLRTCDAEKALNRSENNNPFASSDVTFQLRYLSDGSKSAQHGERSKFKGKTPATPSVSLSQGGEASKLIFIKEKLQGLTSMLEASGGKSSDMITKLESEMKALLEDVNKMVESSLS